MEKLLGYEFKIEKIYIDLLTEFFGLELEEKIKYKNKYL